MPRVTVEMWMWLGKELGNDWQSVSAMRSLLEIDTEEGSTVRQLFETLATRYEAIERKIFVRRGFSPNIVVLVNDRIVAMAEVSSRTLENGDKVTVLPAYAGG